MKLIKTSITGLTVIEPKVYDDTRGYFYEPYNKNQFNKLFGETNFIQDNESKSNKGVLRGLHFQKPPYDQAKLVRCVEGRVLDIAVDLRNESKTYGQHIAIELSCKNKKQLYIPRGFAHGFLVLSESAIFAYKVDNVYAPNYDAGINWNDPTLDIQWGFNKSEIMVSEKDSKLLSFSEFKSPFI